MNRIGLHRLRGVDDRLDIEVTADRGSLPYAHGGVGRGNVHGEAIGFGINREGNVSRLADAADYAHGDLAAISD